VRRVLASKSKILSLKEGKRAQVQESSNFKVAQMEKGNVYTNWNHVTGEKWVP